MIVPTSKIVDCYSMLYYVSKPSFERESVALMSNRQYGLFPLLKQGTGPAVFLGRILAPDWSILPSLSLASSSPNSLACCRDFT
jgi:hypothetical protein